MIQLNIREMYLKTFLTHKEFVALQLRQMTFAIYDDQEKPEEALETYTYKFCYDNEDGASISELETNSSL